MVANRWTGRLCIVPCCAQWKVGLRVSATREPESMTNTRAEEGLCWRAMNRDVDVDAEAGSRGARKGH